MSIFADEFVVREKHGGTWKFREPVVDDLLQLRKCFPELDLSGADEQQFTMDDIDFDASIALVADFIHEWPSNEEINEENVRKLKSKIIFWALGEVSDIITGEASLTEDEEKNSEEFSQETSLQGTPT